MPATSYACPEHLKSGPNCIGLSCGDNCPELVKEEAGTGRWFITMGHAGYNSPANNRDGYASKAKALAAHLHYKGGPARRAAKAAERDAKVAQSSKVMAPNGADETVGVLAESLNAHLTAGGWAMVETQTTRILYKPRHAGMFYNTEAGDLRSRSGRGSVFLGSPKVGLLVSIRWGSGPAPR